MQQYNGTSSAILMFSDAMNEFYNLWVILPGGPTECNCSGLTNSFPDRAKQLS